VIYRSAVDEAVAQNSSQQLAMVRTAAVGVHGEIQAMTARLRQFGSLPSVQNLEVPFLSQRVDAAFGENASGLINLIVRADAGGKLYFWSPKGELLGKGDATFRDEDLWKWASNRANASQVRMIHGWANAVSSRRAIAIPVWRSSPSAEVPKPSNEFNGVLALVIDINRFVEVYLGPAMNDLSDSRLVVGLATPEFGVRMGPGLRRNRRRRCAQPHRTTGTTILDVRKRRCAWASSTQRTNVDGRLGAYSLVSGQIGRRRWQLGRRRCCSSPCPGWFLIARRERQISRNGAI
jgi:hypothetical protein